MTVRFRHRGAKIYELCTARPRSRAHIIRRYRTLEAAEQARRDFWRDEYWRKFDIFIKRAEP